MPEAVTNPLGLTRADYTGQKSTLCVGCGHDQITRTIITAAFESGVDPYRVIKPSGIGCSSKSGAYFIGKGYGINSVHGRMPAVATGAGVANRNLITIGVSGDGDTASIGMGQFIHAVRRNANLVYVLENNGVYGLTKGQLSATSERGSRLKSGEVAEWADIDLCQLAVELGCGFVARSYSGDTRQMVGLLRAAIHHQGFALIDALSPCVTFNNLPDSTKGFAFLRENNFSLHEVGFIAPWDGVEVDQKPGTLLTVEMPDGGSLVLHKLSEEQHDPRDKRAARRILDKDHDDKGHVYTGLLYYSPENEPLDRTLHLGKTPLCELDEERLRPDRPTFENLLTAYR